MSYDILHKHFETAYRTGTDLWSDTASSMINAKALAEVVPAGGIVLDLGCGRGRFAFELVKHGLRVIGLDIIPLIVKQNNEEVKRLTLEKTLRFAEGSVFDIPFAENGFEAVIDIGLLHHIRPDDFEKYVNEVARVTKKDGYLFLVELSKENNAYLSWNPKADEKNDFDYHGVPYHFFTPDEIEKIFAQHFTVISHKVKYREDRDDEAHLVTLLQKK